MKLGLNYAYGAPPGALVQTMESLSFPSLWMPEHVVGFPPEPQSNCFSPLANSR
jgi:hypothetical protein